MRKLLVAGALSLYLVVFAAVSLASAAGTVAGSYTVADLGQGGWVGGPLYTDGTAGGGGGFSEDNGQVAFSFKAQTWRYVDPTHIDVCYMVTSSKNGPAVGSGICLTGFFPAGIPVTDKPVKVPSPLEPGESTIVRVTLAS